MRKRRQTGGIVKTWAVGTLLLFILLVGVSTASTILVSQDPVTLAIAAGNHYAKKGDYETALAWLKKAIALNENSAIAHHNKGVVLHDMGKRGDAIVSFETATRADDAYAKAHYSLALAYYKIKEYEGALQELEHVIRLEPHNANAHFDLGVIHIEKFRMKESTGTVAVGDLDDLRKGLAAYQQAIALEPQFPHAAQNAAIVEEVLKEYST
jgi:tetratricopeptide (TPR) repeat protein